MKLPTACAGLKGDVHKLRPKAKILKNVLVRIALVERMLCETWEVEHYIRE